VRQQYPKILFDNFLSLFKKSQAFLLARCNNRAFEKSQATRAKISNRRQRHTTLSI
jgi:hypothetical protein